MLCPCNTQWNKVKDFIVTSTDDIKQIRLPGDGMCYLHTNECDAMRWDGDTISRITVLLCAVVIEMNMNALI